MTMLKPRSRGFELRVPNFELHFAKIRRPILDPEPEIRNLKLVLGNIVYVYLLKQPHLFALLLYMQAQ